MEFLHNSLQLIEHYMLVYGYWAVFFGVMLENAGIPVPGETILLIAGYFASTGEFHLGLVMLIGERRSHRRQHWLCHRSSLWPDCALAVLSICFSDSKARKAYGK